MATGRSRAGRARPLPAALPDHFRFHAEPVADPAAVVQTGQARFTVLTERLIRLEHSPAAAFEDRASQAFWFRRLPVPAFSARQDGQRVEIETEALRLRYDGARRGFGRESLSVLIKSMDHEWHAAEVSRASRPLRGTARTLDNSSGATQLGLGPMGRAGWSVIDDSASVVFDGTGWPRVREHPNNLDLYFFGYGHDYPACLRDYVRIGGKTPMVPRFVLGNWWSRYWAYTDQELSALLREFHDRGVPLSVCVIDMDWHLDGWTGYTWNRALWPHPEGFLGRLHRMGLRTALNLHPAGGVGPHEAAYERMARALGLDPGARPLVKFDIADPTFAAAYFEVLHHPLEAMGVDFWWLDWQQERVSGIPGLDPLWWLNHLHFLDSGRGGRRPLILSRWGGHGSHRYPIGFSGDTEVTWESLAYQPYFTATAANVAYGWWSHDIGGHMGGVEDDELYARWVQFGAFSPILRLHCTNNPYHERRPWGRGAAAERAASRALRLRHRLIPYIYSMAWRDHVRAIPLVTPMYWWSPEDEGAYESTGQYWFGSELVVAPFAAPVDRHVGLSRQRIWLPEGDWYDFWRGERWIGGGWRVMYGDLCDIPVLARSGAIVPLAPEVGWGGVENPAELEVHVFPGADNAFELYEDDGESAAYLEGAHAVTPIRQRWTGGSLTLTIGPLEGRASLVSDPRRYQVVAHAITTPVAVRLAVGGRQRRVSWQCVDRGRAMRFRIGDLHPGDEAVLAVEGCGPLAALVDSRPARLRRLLRAMPIDTRLKLSLDQRLPDLLEGTPSALDAEGLSTAQISAIESVLRDGIP